MKPKYGNSYVGMLSHCGTLKFEIISCNNNTTTEYTNAKTIRELLNK